ncbi:unnamed protein product [Prunus armeniaca]
MCDVSYDMNWWVLHNSLKGMSKEREVDSLQQGRRRGPSAREELAEDKVGEAIVKLQTSVWCRPKALRCLSSAIESFGSRELRQVADTLEECLPSAGEKACLPWC